MRETICPYPSWSEYWADGVVHLSGTLFSVIAAISLIYMAAVSSSEIWFLPIFIYCLCLMTTFSLSAAYNMSIPARLRAILRRLDRSAIYLMIAGTYTPIALIGVGGEWGKWLVIAVWAIAAIGIAKTLLFREIPERLSLVLYLGQGWLVVLALQPMFATLSGLAFSLVIAGGLIYTAGVIFYRRDDWKFNRAIWHCFVLCAASVHYLAILEVAKIV